jgi:hypothetical protein
MRVTTFFLIKRLKQTPYIYLYISSINDIKMSKENYPRLIRRESIQKMHDLIIGCGDLSLKRYLAICSYQLGLTRKTAMSYIQDLVDLDFIEIDVDKDLIRELKKD